MCLCSLTIFPVGEFKGKIPGNKKNVPVMICGPLLDLNGVKGKDEGKREKGKENITIFFVS